MTPSAQRAQLPAEQGTQLATAAPTQLATENSELLAEALRGLRSSPKRLHPKLFYDAVGARLFEQITELDEYYPTRSELEILHSCAPEIAELAGPGCALIEYGSGAGVKVRLLLDNLVRPAAYIPVDISTEQLRRVASSIASEYPQLQVIPVNADYTRDFRIPAFPPDSRPLAFFPGSTIGNFDPTEAAAFLRRIRRLVGSRGGLVLGVDRVKDPSVLHAAYNDSKGVTAAFNLNVLERLNRELGANFDLEAFRHNAFYNEEQRRIEMHLEVLREASALLGSERVDFEPGETIWTESSYKYDLDRLEALVTSAGFRISRLWTDSGDRFWVAFLTAV
jgi:L-histidine Nalpha-methyltransferase